MRIALIANGSVSASDAAQLAGFSRVVAVDGGYRHCLQWGVRPDLFVGDGDSAQPPENLPKILYPRDKDKTDLELAIELCSACSPEKMAVFGALGRRTDHALYNLSLLTRYPGALCFQSEGETLFAIEGRTRLDSPVGSTLSLIPLHNPAEGVTTHGLKWELCDARLDAQFMSVSNEVLASPVEIVVSHGLLLCCIT